MITTLESLKNLSVASGCGECTSDNIADTIQFMADHYKHNMFDGEWDQGYINGNDGTLHETDNNLTTTHFMNCNAGDTVKVKPDSVMAWICIFYYNDDSTVPLSSTANNHEDELTGVAPVGTTKIKICVGQLDPITPDDVSMIVTID